MSKPLTVLTLLMFVVCLALVGFLWWIPVNFGYPWYTVLGNLVPTAILGLGVWGVAEVVNS